MIKQHLKQLLNIKIISDMYQLTKVVYRFCHKGVTASKAIGYYIKWNITSKKKVYNYISSCYGVDCIRSWNPLHWKDETVYLRGKINGQEIFIKAFGKIKTTRREITSINKSQERSELLCHHTQK